MTKKIPTSTDCNFQLLARRQCDYNAAGFAETLHGRKTDVDIHGCNGVALTIDAAVLRTYRPDAHMFCVRLGDRWYEIDTVPADAVAALDDNMVDMPESPQRIAAERQRDEERKRRLEAEQAHKESRRRYHLGLRERAAAKQRAALDARRAAR